MSHPAFRCAIPGIPVAQGRGRAVPTAAGIRVMDPPKARSWKGSAKVVMQAARQGQGCSLLVGPLEAVIRCYWPSIKPDRKANPRPAEWRGKRPDADNLAKSTLDAAQGIVFEDDAQVVLLRVEKRHAAQGEPPRVELEVWPIAALASDDVPARDAAFAAEEA